MSVKFDDSDKCAFVPCCPVLLLFEFACTSIADSTK